MGKIIKTTIKLYSDSNYSQLVSTIDKCYIGIAVGNTEKVGFQHLYTGRNETTPLFNFFTDRLNSGEDGFLGGNIITNSSDYTAERRVPSNFLPLCTPKNGDVKKEYYAERVFPSGAKIRYGHTIGTSGELTFTGLDGNGSVLFKISGDSAYLYRPQYFTTSKPNLVEINYACLVVSNMTGNKITDDATLSRYYVNATYGSVMWGGVLRLNRDENMNKFIAFLNGEKGGIPIPSTDPYDKGGSSSSSGGSGTFGGGNTIFGGASDSVDIPPLPTASASSAGFITLFNPSIAQLNNLANYMWSDLFSLDTFKKIFADPMDCILGLSIVPVKPASAGTSAVKIGNVSTDVSMNKTSSQYVAVDCGTIEVKEYWGAYLDYAPYTQCEIYLPYVGTKQISVDDVMNKSVHVVYHVDILSGACNAYVKCGDSVLYTFVGQCSSSIPISGNDWTNVLNGAISVAGKIGLAMATGGATALMSGIGAASSIISSSKPTVERSGAMSSTGGLLGIQKPYLILTRPKQALPENQNKYTGYPSFITMALSDCTGYTEVDSVHLENMSCTDEEALEIENLLKSGVIF